jgi:chromatin structure-remodeling complex subunit RSC4
VDAENDGEPGSGDEGGKKKKTPNLSRVLKLRLQKLVDKTADECALSCILSHTEAHSDPLADGLSLPNSWNSPTRNFGLTTTKLSRDLSVSRTSLYAFPVQRPTQSHLVPQKKLKRKEYHTSGDFSRDVQLVFSNAMEFNAEGSQIYGDAQTLKVRSLEVGISAPEAKQCAIVLLPPVHV